ncbi:MAG: hypothetical protein JXA49_08520 [Actinobacteria bacterium]|nr:hypothetical protein [Actinomycetota bacterium]
MGFFDKIQDTINTAAEQTKVKSQDVQLKRDRKQSLEALGEQAYNLYISGQLTQQELAAGCEAVAQLDRQLQEVANQVQASRPQVPGAPNQPGAVPPPQPEVAAAAPQVPAPQPPAPPQAQPFATPEPPQETGGIVPPPPPPPTEGT